MKLIYHKLVTYQITVTKHCNACIIMTYFINTIILKWKYKKKYQSSQDKDTFTVLPKPAYKLTQEDMSCYRQTKNHKIPFTNPIFWRIEDTNMSHK